MPSKERLEDMAKLMLMYPGLTPETYWNLTFEERSAMIDVYFQVNKKK